MSNKQNNIKNIKTDKNKIKSKKFLNLRALFIIFVILFLITAWARLTRAGYLDNWLGIELLCNVDQSPIITPIKDVRHSQDIQWGKPVIYFYPEIEQEVEVSLDFAGDFLVTYPEYNEGWSITAFPDGKIINSHDQQEYSYLFWEGVGWNEQKYDLSEGFVVRGENIVDFLQNTLAYLGLEPKELNEFIVYWVPQMIQNKYNLVHFATLEEYANKVKLNVVPQPDSVLRIFMVFKSIEEQIDIEPQKLLPFKRAGFSVIEWGGVEIR